MKEIPLTKGFVTVVDDEDYKELSKFKWYTLVADTGKSYAVRNIPTEKGQRRLTMPRAILGYAGPLHVDHVNGNTLDNRRANLRLATRSQNGMNRGKPRQSSSQYKGVSFFRNEKKWHADITANSKRIALGYFTSEIEAAKAYDQAALRYHGEFARLNFPEEVSSETQ